MRAFPIRFLILLADARGRCPVVGLQPKVFQIVAAPLARVLDGVGRAYPGTLTKALQRRWIVLAAAVAVFVGFGPGHPASRHRPGARPGPGRVRLPAPAARGLDPRGHRRDGRPDRGHAGGRLRICRGLLDGRQPALGRLGTADPGREPGPDQLPDGAETDAEDEAAAVDRVRTAIARFPRAEAELVRPAVLSVRPPIAVQIFSDNLVELDQAAETVRKALEDLPEVRDVATTSEPGNPEILVELDRERAAALGVSAEDVGAAMRTKIRGDVVGEFREGEERIDIRLRAGERFRSLASGRPGAADHPSRRHDGAGLGGRRVVTGRGPAAIYRYSGARVAEVTALPTTRDLGGALTRSTRRCRSLVLPAGARTELAGQNEELSVSFNSLWLAMALAIFLVYVVMASQFESLIHPFVILMAVPLGVVGVVAALVLTSNSVSVLVLIGAVMLAGIVVNNAIVLVDAVNRRRREGEGIDEALVGAGGERLRPILMTTATTVLALFPMALGLGAGDELRAPLAITVIGGLTVATLLTLIVIPCIYRILGAAPVRVRVEEEVMNSEFGIRNSEFVVRPSLDQPQRGAGWKFRIQNSKFKIREGAMRLTDIPLDRPVATLMLLLSLTVLGTVAVFLLPLDFMPVVNEPEIDIEIPFPGAHPLEALREVVEPIEEEIATIPDVKRILANTQSGSARIEVMFDWGVDVDIKKMEVREAVDRARPVLPEAIGHISIRGDTDGGSAQVLAGRISAERNLSESWDLLDRRIRRPLERIKGVARVDLYGVEPQQVRIDLDLDALRRHGIDAGEVLDAVNAANLDVDAGVIRGDVVRYDVRTLTRFQSADEIAALRVGRTASASADVAVVELREPRLDYGRHLDRSFAIGIDVYKEPSANTVEVVDKALDRIEEIRADPQLEGINLLVWENQGEEIRNSLSGLRNAGIFGGMLAIVVLHFFLRRFRTTLIVAIAIPFSLLVTCGAMFALGSQFNVLTLLGLMLGVGMLVDNAVVVIENIHRYEGMGNPAPVAARLGARQVALAVVASTATTIFVWSWLFVSERDTMVIIIGEVALTICLAVACSLLISLTFIPLAAARFAPAEKPRPGIVVRKVVPAYRRLLDWTLDHRLVTLICLFAIAGSAAWPLMQDREIGRHAESDPRGLDLLAGPRRRLQGGSGRLRRPGRRVGLQPQGRARLRQRLLLVHRAWLLHDPGLSARGQGQPRGHRASAGAAARRAAGDRRRQARGRRPRQLVAPPRRPGPAHGVGGAARRGSRVPRGARDAGRGADARPRPPRGGLGTDHARDQGAAADGRRRRRPQPRRQPAQRRRGGRVRLPRAPSAALPGPRRRGRDGARSPRGSAARDRRPRRSAGPEPIRRLRAAELGGRGHHGPDPGEDPAGEPSDDPVGDGPVRQGRRDDGRSARRWSKTAWRALPSPKATRGTSVSGDTTATRPWGPCSAGWCSRWWR